MAIALLFILLPGIISFAVANRLSGYSSQPVNKVIIELTLHSSFIVFIYTAISALGWFSLPKVAELVRLSVPLLNGHPGAEVVDGILDKADHALLALFVIALVCGGAVPVLVEI